MQISGVSRFPLQVGQRRFLILKSKAIASRPVSIVSKEHALRVSYFVVATTFIQDDWIKTGQWLHPPLKWYEKGYPLQKKVILYGFSIDSSATSSPRCGTLIRADPSILPDVDSTWPKDGYILRSNPDSLDIPRAKIPRRCGSRKGALPRFRP